MCLFSSFQILLSLIIISVSVIYSIQKKWRNRRKQQKNDSNSNKYGENSSVSEENKDNGRELKKNLPSISFLPFLWNIVFFQRDIQFVNSHIGILSLNVSVGLSRLFTNDKVACINILGYKLILFLHPESAKEVLRSNSLINRDSTYDFFKPLLGYNSLFFSSDDDWRIRRKYLAPHGHVWNLKDDQNIFMEHSNVLVEKLKQLQENEIFNILEWTKYCTLDIITDLTVGVSLHSQTTNDQEYVSAMHRILKCFPPWLVNPMYWIFPIFFMTKMGKNYKKDVEIIHRFNEKLFKRRKENLVKKMQEQHSLDKETRNEEESKMKTKQRIIDSLLDLHVKQGLISEEDVIREMGSTIFAGFDSVAHVVSWVLYFLGRFHEMQEKVYLELQEIFKNDVNRDITIDDLTKMTYLECVIKESMRIYPPFPLIARKNPSEMKIDNYVLPANSTLVINIYGIHHNPSVYENPEVFDPDRFLFENYKNLHPYAYLAFSSGPRNCFASKAAMIIMKTILANVLRNFKVYSLDPQDKIVTTFVSILTPISGIRMCVEKRHML